MRASSVLFLVCLLHTVQSRVTEAPTSALRPKDELRELVNTRVSDRKVTVTAAASLSAEIQTSAIRAVAKLLATCGLGVWSAKQGILDQQALSVLSKLVFHLFQPCLLFVNVAQTVSTQAAKGDNGPAFLLPAVGTFQIFLGYVIGKVMSLFMYGSDPEHESESKQFLIGTTFGNSGPLPLVFTDALFRTATDTTLLPRSVAFISLYLLGWSPLFWVVGSVILSKKDDGSMTKAQKRKVMLNRILSPPVLASLLGMVVGSNKFLTSLFMPKDGIFHPIFEGMRTLSTGYLPAVLLVLAGSLMTSSGGGGTVASSRDAGKKSAYMKFKESFGISSGKQFFKQVGALYVCRFILMPMIGFAVFEGLQYVAPGLYTYLKNDPLLLFVVLLETFMPSAQNSVTITQLAGDKEGSAALSRTLLAIYALGTPAITYWLVKLLHLTELSIH